jgi:ankyrin repeat protein
MFLQQLKQYKGNEELVRNYLNGTASIQASDLLQKDPETKVNALAYVSSRLSINAYNSLMSKVSFVEKLKMYLLHPEIFQIHIAQSVAVSSKDLCDYNEQQKMPALIYTGIILSVRDYTAMMAKVSEEALDEVLLENGTGCGLALHMTITCADVAIAKALIRKTSSRVFNTIALTPGILPLLQTGAKNLDQEGFMELLNKASTETLKHTLLIENNEGENLMHVAARYQGPKSFEALCARASSEMPEAFKKAILIQDKEGWTPFACAIVHQNSNIIQKLITKLGRAAIDEALQLKTREKLNRRPSRPEVLNKVSKAWIGKNSRKSCYSSNALHLVGQFFDSKSFQTLLSSASKDALSKALTKRDSNGRTPLQIADRYQNAEAIDMLRLIAEPSAFETARRSDESSGYAWTKLKVEALFPSVIANVESKTSREVADAEEFDITPFLKATSIESPQKRAGSRPLPPRP